MADAIILAMTGGSDLLAKTQFRYFQVTRYILLHESFLLFAISSLRYTVKAEINSLESTVHLNNIYKCCSYPTENAMSITETSQSVPFIARAM
jgi:hypothetical protein